MQTINYGNVQILINEKGEIISMNKDGRELETKLAAETVYNIFEDGYELTPANATEESLSPFFSSIFMELMNINRLSKKNRSFSTYTSDPNGKNFLLLSNVNNEVEAAYIIEDGELVLGAVTRPNIPVKPAVLGDVYLNGAEGDIESLLKVSCVTEGLNDEIIGRKLAVGIVSSTSEFEFEIPGGEGLEEFEKGFMSVLALAGVKGNKNKRKSA